MGRRMEDGDVSFHSNRQISLYIQRVLLKQELRGILNRDRAGLVLSTGSETMGTHITRCLKPPYRINSILCKTPTGTTPLVPIFGHPDRLLASIGGSCRFGLRAILCILAIHYAYCDVVAQEGTRSHRLLGNGIPTLSGGQSQMELLRRLQMLSGTAQAEGRTPEDSPFADAEALKRLQQAMQRLQKLKTEPPGASARNQQRPQSANDGSATVGRNSKPSLKPPGQQDGNGASQRGSKPDRSALQRIAEQMGLSLDGLPAASPDSRSSEQPATGQPSAGQLSPGTGRTPPRPGGNSRSGTPPPTEQGNSNTLPERISQDGPPFRQSLSNRNSETGMAAGDENSGRAQPGRSTPDPDSLPRASGATGTANRAPGSNSGSNPGTSEPPKGSMQSLLDWLKKQGQSASGSKLPPAQKGTQPDRSPASRLVTPGNGRPGQPRTNSGGRQQTTGRTSNNQGRNGSENVGSSNQDEPATPGRSWFPGGSITPPGSQQENTQTNQDRMNRDANQGGTAGRPSTNSEKTGGNDAAAGGGTKHLPTDNSNNDAESLRQSIEDRLNAQREERLDEVRGSKKTLRQKLVEIAKLARSESDRAEFSEDATDSETGEGLQSAFVDALAKATKGLTEQIDEIVTDDRFSRRGRDRRSSRRNRDGPFGQFAGLGNRANEWFVDAVESESSATTILSNGGSGGSTGGSFSPGLLVGLFIILGLAFWLLQRKRADAHLQSSQSALTPAPENLQNRQDIVQAFHDLAARCPAVMADWWTHDRAARALAISRPDVDDEVRQLAQLYEQARYQSEDSALTDEQLAAAKAAWLRCRKS